MAGQYTKCKKLVWQGQAEFAYITISPYICFQKQYRNKNTDTKHQQNKKWGIELACLLLSPFLFLQIIENKLQGLKYIFISFFSWIFLYFPYYCPLFRFPIYYSKCQNNIIFHWFSVVLLSCSLLYNVINLFYAKMYNIWIYFYISGNDFTER